MPSDPFQPSEPTPSNVFDAYLQASAPPADGFDFPVGNADGKGPYVDRSNGRKHNGWFIATTFGEHYKLGIHPGEDWNGNGGGDTDIGQDVYAVANGRVIYAANFGQPWGNVVVIDHSYYVNHEKRYIRSVYAHLQDFTVQAGVNVTRRERIGSIGKDPNKTFPAHLHLELRRNFELSPTYWPSSNDKDDAWVRENYVSPSDFISSHRALFVPQTEKTLVLVDQETYKMRIYRDRSLIEEFDISLGQGTGPKEREGDNKTPKGMYFVIGKHKGNFEGSYGSYYGGHWIKVNYPNMFDARRGVREGMISSDQASQITSRWLERSPTVETTSLGGGIGFHGWIREWENEGQRHLSWGCVVMHLRDIGGAYNNISAGTMVVIF
jgi:murein DD-endopeptidase MepM/ murein hydrolase activator NlpD